MPFWRLYYHIVWAMKGREPWLCADVERMVCGAILGKARDIGIRVHAIGNADDHIHMLVSLAPTKTLSEAVGLLKGASSHYVNASGRAPFVFAWQEGYGAVAVGEQAVHAVADYVRDQRRHHAGGKVYAHYETSEASAGAAA